MASRGAGLKVAAHRWQVVENLTAIRRGPAQRQRWHRGPCHRIHDALEAAYGGAFLPDAGRANAQVLLKALLVPCRLNGHRRFAGVIKKPRSTYAGPVKRQNRMTIIRRFLGYGYCDADER